MNPTLSTLLDGATPGFLAAAALLAVMPWVKRDSPWRILPIAIVLAFTARYLYWRVTATIPPSDNLVDFGAGLLFFAVECAAVAGSVISYISLTRTRNRTAEADANSGWLFDQERLPLVDVFICTYNEEREILERTIIGAMAMDYPNYRLWVLDDGRRPWLAELAAELKCNYLTRPDNKHAKAGNLNHAIRHVRGLNEPPDFISVLDADFVPVPIFLSRALTLFRDECVGIVQTPQHFINPDPIQANLKASDAWPDEQRYFFDVLMPSKDAWGTAFCCGTSSVIRMAALAKSGGFPTDSVTEDYLLTLRLQRHGYGTAYLNERLSIGLAPEGLQEYITQRSRWCLGFFQIIRSGDGPFARSNRLRPIDRISLVESMLYWAGSYSFRVAGLIVPILYLLFGIHAVNVDTVDGIANFLPYYLAQVTVMAWLSGQRVLPVMTDVSQLLAAREILTAITIGLIRPKGQKFKVTAKGGDRSRTIVQWRMMGIFAFLLLLTVLGIAFAFGGNKSLQDSSAIALYWSWYNMLILIAAIAVCVEKPRMRRNERLRGEESVALTVGTQRRNYRTADISVGGMRLVGGIAAAPGTPVSVEFRSQRFEGRVVRRSERDFAIEIANTLSGRSEMVRHVYSGAFKSPVGQIHFANVAKRVAARLSG
ncbi:glycosyltransferase [Oricola cellulosilytica]|uniref:Glycosyltransferase n=1 Tax=Oricola cellulosilytica TaxID=1429082 RepID=A0A4R0PF81_9HYPH|nr:glycosyltransferase [Oricola cellulosilytica]TCD16281.1 glycosyltransferase [Oricola cellulosilytica]